MRPASSPREEASRGRADALGRLLPLWFVLWDAVRLGIFGFVPPRWETAWLGIDFRIYREAAVRLSTGGDPWTASVGWGSQQFHFAGLPTTAQLFVPFALLPEWFATGIWLAITVGGAVFILRRLRLPIWWLLFPPLLEGCLSGNPQVLILGLLLVGPAAALRPVSGETRADGPRSPFGLRSGLAAVLGRAVAFGLKPYAAVPIIARREWRALGACIALLALSVAVDPALWSSYLGTAGEVTARLQREAYGGFSAWFLVDPFAFGRETSFAGPLGWAVLAVVVGLLGVVALRDVRAAGWLLVPLLWPSAQYHYATFALPVARRLGIWIISIPTPVTAVVGLLILAYEAAAARPALVRTTAPESLRAWMEASIRSARGLPPPADRADTGPSSV